MSVEQRVAELGLEFPPEPLLPNGVRVPFEWVRIVGERCVISGHGALGADGAPAGPFGRVPSEVPLEAAQQSARAAVFAMLGSLRRTVGSLDRISDWVLNAASDLLLEVFGENGRHARTAIGVAALPLNVPVVTSAELVATP